MVGFLKIACASLLIAAFAGRGAKVTPVPSRLIGFQDELALDDKGQWQRTVDPEMQWNELIVSWNADLQPTGKLTVEAMVQGADRWYVLGIWTNDKTTRKSVNEQKSEAGEVSTDTLIVPATESKVNLRITGEGAALKLITLSFANREAATAPGEKSEVGLGKVLEPPRRAQMSYPNGKVICSATSTSMLLGYWAKELSIPTLDVDVPAVCDGVFDPEWPGTGNWPFNTAFAGSQPGMRGYVARLWNVEQLQRWIDRGIPVACSVSNQLLQGNPKGKNDGHIVVLVGFTPEGDPVFNDPGRNVVRMTYKRADFEAAWASSGRTCYLVYPKHYAAPENRERCWLD